jgi:carbon monoxide dehydrogenase subunit G
MCYKRFHKCVPGVGQFSMTGSTMSVGVSSYLASMKYVFKLKLKFSFFYLVKFPYSKDLCFF